MLKYNNNITIKKEIDKNNFKEYKLKKYEYYALMVEDKKYYYNDDRVFFNDLKGWLGLECTSGNKIYITKDFYKRFNKLRGITMVVKVLNIKDCYMLT